ncbi:MAG: protein kinase, partial [Solirubrobacterales bacterium]|nr:protein kinase [Solirubrobacterales bacterium]
MTSPGEVLNERYRLMRRLGGDGMGTVWQAFDADLERLVAVKELASGNFGDEDAATRRERVRREAIALAQVEHPVIVTVHDLISVGEDKAPWIVMRYVPGEPLSDVIKRHR